MSQRKHSPKYLTLFSECPGRSIFIFFIKENWNCGMNRYNAEPNINLLLTGNISLTMMLDNEVIL